jgi:hypothetical protein
MKHETTSKAKKVIRRLLMLIAKPAYLKPPPNIAPAIIEPPQAKPATRKWGTFRTAKRIKPLPGASKNELEDFEFATLQIKLTKRLNDKGIVTNYTPPPTVKQKPKGRFMDNIGKIFDYAPALPIKYNKTFQTA